MFDKDFWGEIISTYTDADAMEDGVLIDVSNLRVRFNGKIISRVTTGAALVLQINDPDSAVRLITLQHVAEHAEKDREEDAWGIFQSDIRFGGENLWLIPNEMDGYTLLLPSEY